MYLSLSHNNDKNNQNEHMGHYNKELITKKRRDLRPNLSTFITEMRLHFQLTIPM